MSISPITLRGTFVELEPLTRDDLESLCTIGLDEDLWRLTTTIIRTRQDMQAYIDAALDAQMKGTALPFIITSIPTGETVGCTRYGNIDMANKRVEIGWTWIAKDWQRTEVNTETKFLLLRYAFETLGCVRVEFKTDALNARSRQALLRIGATEEGIFRQHMIVPGGRLRDSVYFSILATEWPEIKKKLQHMLIRSW